MQTFRSYQKMAPVLNQIKPDWLRSAAVCNGSASSHIYVTMLHMHLCVCVCVCVCVCFDILTFLCNEAVKPCRLPDSSCTG